MMFPYFIASGTLAQLDSLLRDITHVCAPDGLVILGCVDNNIDEETADQYFRQMSVPVGGGLFPSIIHNQQVHKAGWLVYAVHGELGVTCTTDVSRDMQTGITQLSRKSDGNSDAEIRLVIVDAHATSISSFLSKEYDRSSVSTKFFGGGAGSLTSTTTRCIICNSGLLRDAAVVLRITGHCGVGVSHGWRATSPILRATSTSGNTVHELNFRPALEVYAELIKSEFHADIDPDDLIGTASMFPLGIRRLGGSIIVRDPIASTDQGGLVCVGEFDDNCFVYVLSSAMEELLASTASAVQQAEKDLGKKTEHKIVFDCISRFLLMKDQFNSELTMLEGGVVATSGVLSIGEIASSNDGFLEFYNKTTAVVAFPGE
jgi:hypothetical protein